MFTKRQTKALKRSTINNSYYFYRSDPIRATLPSASSVHNREHYRNVPPLEAGRSSYKTAKFFESILSKIVAAGRRSICRMSLKPGIIHSMPLILPSAGTFDGSDPFEAHPCRPPRGLTQLQAASSSVRSKSFTFVDNSDPINSRKFSSKELPYYGITLYPGRGAY